MASVFLLISRNQPPCWDTTSKKDEALYPNRAEVSMLGVSQLDRVVEVVERSLQGHTVSLLNHRSSLPSLDLPKVRKNRCVAACRKQHIRRSHKVLEWCLEEMLVCLRACDDVQFCQMRCQTQHAWVTSAAQEIIPISGGCLGNCRSLGWALKGSQLQQLMVQLLPLMLTQIVRLAGVCRVKQFLFVLWSEALTAKQSTRGAPCPPTLRRLRHACRRHDAMPWTKQSCGVHAWEAIVARALQAVAEGVSEVWLTSEDTGGGSWQHTASKISSCKRS